MTKSSLAMMVHRGQCNTVLTSRHYCDNCRRHVQPEEVRDVAYCPYHHIRLDCVGKCPVCKQNFEFEPEKALRSELEQLSIVFQSAWYDEDKDFFRVRGIGKEPKNLPSKFRHIPVVWHDSTRNKITRKKMSYLRE